MNASAPEPTAPEPTKVARGTRGAVASPHYLASAAGLHILRAGGSAVDAAIATNAALAVVAAHSCGLGGDAFWLIWDGERVHGLNGSGRSGRRASLEAATAAGLREMPLHGPWTVTVPGAIHSWGQAHARFGRLPWQALLEPAIELADSSPATREWCAAIERSAETYGVGGDWARTFRPASRPWHENERVSLPFLANTLRLLADEGPDDAYTGPLAARAAKYLHERGSPLLAQDFAEHRSDWTEPISIGYRGATSLSHPPNSCGALALEMLGLLERFQAPARDAFGLAGVDDARWVHIGLEAARLALSDRDRVLTDADAMPANAVAELLDPARLDQVAGRINPERAAHHLGGGGRAGGGTVFLATADGEGNVVSLTESNYAGFGSGLVDPETGIAYQNRGAFFSLDPAHPNVLAPSKRTLHTLTPGMLLRDGRPWIAHGQMGGEIQPQVFAQFVSAVVDGGVDIATGLTAPRWAALMPGHMQPPRLTVLEAGYSERVAEGLRRYGHDVIWEGRFSSNMGQAQAIEIVDREGGRTLIAASDPRSDGAALAW